MRTLSLACLLLTLAAPAVAQDRYGPQPAARATPIVYAPVARLSWPGKVEPTAPPVVTEMDAMPRALADGALRRTSAYGLAPAPAPSGIPVAPAVMASADPAPAENAPWRRLTAVPTTPRPTAAPVAMEESAAPVTTPPVPASPAPAPQRVATGEQARYYSLHRDYGETPDAIPAPEKGQVFLAGGPLTSGVGEGDAAAASEDTGRTAAINKARLAADWSASSGK